MAISGIHSALQFNHRPHTMPRKTPPDHQKITAICIVGPVHLIKCCSPVMRLTYTLPLLCTLTNLLSSEKTTFIQSSTVKRLYFLAYSTRRRPLRKLINDFLCANLPNDLPSLSLMADGFIRH